MGGFKFLRGDISFPDYGGKLYRKLNSNVYHVIDLIDMEDACSEAGYKWDVTLQEIDIDVIPEKTIRSAKECCSCDESNMDEKTKKLLLVEQLSDYGAYAPLGNWGGNNYKKLLKEARQMSREMDDPQKHEEALNKPCNKIGSTAREFMIGDFNSAMVRGISSGDTGARIMGKMHGLSENDMNEIQEKKITTEVRSAQISLDKIPSDDPLAYMMGFMHGVNVTSMPEDRDDLAEAYKAGYKFGTAVRIGDEKWPAWAK